MASRQVVVCLLRRLGIAPLQSAQEEIEAYCSSIANDYSLMYWIETTFLFKLHKRTPVAGECLVQLTPPMTECIRIASQRAEQVKQASQSIILCGQALMYRSVCA